MTDTRSANEATRDRIANMLAANAGRERRTVQVDETPKPITVAKPMLSDANPRTLSDLDVSWLDRLDPTSLDPKDVATLRTWRKRTTRRDEHRLLDRVLAHDDQARVAVDYRREAEGELRQIEAELHRGGGVNSAQAAQIDRWRAESDVRAAIGEAVQAEHERWQGDPRRTNDRRVWTGSEWVDEGYAEHAGRLRQIEATREQLVEAALRDRQTERANTWKQREPWLVARRRELQAWLAQANRNNGGT